jgi:asparagine synthase (glutamine-hydrolysing)
MCGIAGVVDFTGRLDLGNQCQQMLTEIHHRGPDANGFNQSENTAIGSTRLSILDLAARANMPFVSEDGNYILVFNGEIYNFRELRAQLEKEGISFKTESDTEVLFHWLIRRGANHIHELSGMFGFAFLDKRKNTLILARDRSGIKPLYYYKDDRSFLFGSEIKSITKVLDSNRLKLDFFSLRDIFSLGYVHGPYSPFENLSVLPPGNFLMLNTKTGEYKVSSFNNLLDYLDPTYWEKRKKKSKDEIRKELKADLEESVRSHMVSDAPLGVVCSGGVDSSLLSVIAKKFNPDIQLFHASVEGPGSEEKFATALSNSIGAQMHVIKVTRKAFIENWVRAVYHNDFPSYHQNDVPMYLVCQLARDNKHKVLLSGEGADELFGGYEVNRELDSRGFWMRWMTRLPKGIRGRLNTVFEGMMSAGAEKYADKLNATGISSVGRMKSLTYNEILLQGHGTRSVLADDILRRLAFLTKGEQVKTAYLSERFYGHLQTLLMRNDKMGMMASIESRIPYLSNLLLEKWVGMPIRFKIKDSGSRGLKYMLKDLCKEYGLPEMIYKRKKVGFATPITLYVKPSMELFKGGFLENSMGLKLSESFMKNDITSYYRMGSIEIWGRLFVLRQPITEVETLIARIQEV